jgi:hypothetical protein
LRDATHATSKKRSAKRRDTVVHWFAAVVSGGVSSASSQWGHAGLLKIHFESERRRRDDTSFARNKRDILAQVYLSFGGK